MKKYTKLIPLIKIGDEYLSVDEIEKRLKEGKHEYKSREEFEKWYNLYFNYLHKLNESKINLTIRENVAFEAWQEQQKKIEQLEEYREELIQMFKNLIEEKKYTTYCAYADNGWSHEESTRKAREEVKAELELLQKVRKER